MKRFLIVPIIAVLLAGGASAAEIGFGAKGGFNMANLHGSDAENMDWKTGFAGGAFLNVSFTPIISLQPELLYVMDGASEDLMGFELNFNLDYVQIPVLVKFDLPVKGTIVPAFYAGPYVSFLTGADWEVSYGDASESVDVKDYTKTTDFGLLFGAEIDVHLSAVTLTFEGRYNYGTVTVDDGWANAFEEPERGELSIKNHSIMFLAGVAF